MHPEALAVGGYILLFSSIVVFGFLFKKPLTQWMNTSFYALSISDVLYTILTASLLLTHHFDVIQKVYNTEGNGSNAFTDIWTEQVQDGKQHQIVFEDTHEDDDITSDEMLTLCTFKDIVMQYAVILIPLINSFISLLMFSIQCNLKMISLKKECAKFLQLKKINNDDNDGSETCKNENCMADNSDLSICNETSASRGTGKNIKFFKFLNSSESRYNNKKVVSGLVISQWLIPILTTMILYFAEPINVSHTRAAEGEECDYKNYFLFNDYDSDGDRPLQNISTILHDVISQHITNEIDLQEPKPNDTQVSEIVLKVHSIINGMVNETSDMPTHTIESTDFYNNSEWLNITQYIHPKINTSKIQEAITEPQFNLTKEISTTKDMTTPSQMENVQNNLNVSQKEKSTLEYDAELMLFNTLVKKSAAQIASASQETTVPYEASMSTEDSHPVITQTENAATEAENITTEITESVTAYPTTDISRDHIYADILKRIHGASGISWLKNYQKHQSYNRKKPKENNLINEQREEGISFARKLFYINKFVHSNATISKSMKPTCYVSPRLLKAHLLALLFLIYFAPILLCCILQIHGNTFCKLLVTRLRTRLKTYENFNSTDGHAKQIYLSGNSSSHNSNLEEPCNPSGWFAGFNNEDLEQSTVQNINTEITSTCTDMMQEAESIRNLFCTMRKSLLLGIIMWTPIFLEVLLKVFLCTRAPKWLTDILFLTGIGFGILRNIINLNMIKLQNVNENVVKLNSIHPTKY